MRERWIVEVERLDAVVRFERSERELEKVVLVGLEERELSRELPRVRGEMWRV